MPTLSASHASAITPRAARLADPPIRRSPTVPPYTLHSLPLDADHPLSLVDRIVCGILQAPQRDQSVPPSSDMTGGRQPSVEQLSRTLLLQVLYAEERDERLLEQLHYDLRFRWFAGLQADDVVWTVGTHVRARQAMLNSFSGRHLLGELLRKVRPIVLTWPERFSFDETLVDRWGVERATDAPTTIEAHQRELLQAAGLDDNAGMADSRLIRAMELILTRLCDPSLNGDAVAAEIGMSRRALYYLFEAHGLTPSMVIRNIRLHQCKRLLEAPRHSHRKISAIALDCGFGNVYTFGRTFKQRYGMGPRECRRARQPA